MQNYISKNNGEVHKAIDFKISKILTAEFFIKKNSNISPIKRSQIELSLKNPINGKTLKEALQNYYFGLFYDGVVYFLVFDTGFFIARENEVKINKETNDLYFGNLKPVSFKKIENKNQALNIVEPQYLQIENEINEKYFSQLLNVELLDRGTIISEVIKSNGATEEEMRSFASKLKSRFGFKNNASSKYSFLNSPRKNNNSILAISKDMDYQVNTVKLSDLSNTELAERNRDYIYNFLGVPPQIMGSNSTSTYSNYQEALKNFLINTIIPEVINFVNLINSYYLKGEKTKIDANLGKISEELEDKQAKISLLLQLEANGNINGKQLLEELGLSHLIDEGGGELWKRFLK